MSLLSDKIIILVDQLTVPPNPLPVPYCPQQQTQQCWAACVDMVLDFFQEPDVRQCQIAGQAFKRGTGCCEAPSSSLCNKGLKDKEITRLWKTNGIRPDYVGYSVSFEVIQEEIGKEQPVEVGLTFNLYGPRGHVVIVRGWRLSENGQQHVFVNDPDKDKGAGQVLFSHLQSAYGKGGWTATWTNIKR